MAIRPAVDADVPGIRECVRAAYAVYLGRLDLPPEPLSHDYAAQVRDHLTHVEVDGTVRGVLVLFDRADHLFVENLAVHPADQGRGIGSRLLDYSANRARGLGRAELRLCTNERMTENLRYYAARGFREDRRALENGRARVFLSKRVGPGARRDPVAPIRELSGPSD